MLQKGWNLDVQKIKYYKIYKIKCKVLKEDVFFNSHGFNHLIRKGNKSRSISDQIRRFSLLKYCRLILEDNKTLMEMRFIKSNNKIMCFYGLIGCVNDRGIKIVIRRVNRGKLFFLSIMDFR